MIKASADFAIDPDQGFRHAELHLTQSVAIPLCIRPDNLKGRTMNRLLKPLLIAATASIISLSVPQTALAYIMTFEDIDIPEGPVIDYTDPFGFSIDPSGFSSTYDHPLIDQMIGDVLIVHYIARKYRYEETNFSAGLAWSPRPELDTRLELDKNLGRYLRSTALQRIIDSISDYFLMQRVKPSQDDYAERLQKHHAVIVAATHAKQNSDVETIEALHAAVLDIAPYYRDSVRFFDPCNWLESTLGNC